MLWSAAEEDGSALVADCWSRLGFSRNSERRSAPSKVHQTLYRFDEASNLHYEGAAWDQAGRVFVVAYIGRDGTYQVHRPHFLDFMRQVAVPERE
jgi:hypothetical protein